MAGQLVPRGPNTWLVRVSLGRDPQSGKRKYHNKTIRGTKKDAQRYLNGIMRDLDLGTFVEPSSMTVNAFLDQWLGTAKGRVRPVTYRDYEGKLQLYVRPAIGALKLSKVSPLDLQGLYASMLARGLSPRTVRYTHAVLANALDQAVKWRLLTHNPAKHVDLPRQQRKEMAALNREEATRFLEAAKGDRLGFLFSFALSSGMRPGEYLGVQWKDIDLEAGTVVVQRGLVQNKGGWYFAEPKTSRSRRTIHLPHALLPALHQHRKQQLEERMAMGGDYNNHDLVFATSTGNPLSESNLVKRHFKPLLKRAGLPDIRLYDLRHTCATLLLLKGTNPKIVSERLGHASITLTLDTYSHVLPTMQQSAAAHLDEVLFGAG